MGISQYEYEYENGIIPKNGNYDLKESFCNNMITFSESCCGYCVGMIDIVNSTKITARLSNTELSAYYEMFLNGMTTMMEKYDAIVVKNVGDSILYYFPDTADAGNKEALVKCLDASLKMLELHEGLNKNLVLKGLPCIDYRISCEYGQVIKAKSRSSFQEDIFGTTVNLCALINSLTFPNTVVVGGDLYTIVKGFSQYAFQELKSYSLGFRLDYPMYLIKRSRGHQV